MSGRAVVLYEDQRGPTNDFAFHALVLACVADRLGRDRWALGDDVTAVPKKGDSKLLVACREEADGLASNAQRVFAVFDMDKIGGLLKVANLCKKQVIIPAIKQGCSAPEVLDIVLLERNLESVLRAIAKHCDGITDTVANEAIDKKRHVARDRMFHRAAAATPEVRNLILKDVKDLKRLVTRLEAVIRTGGAPE